MVSDSVSVLMIDDDASFLDMSSEFLRSIGTNFEITTCSSGQDGVEWFCENDVDCIVCDYEMGTLDGLDVLQEVRTEDEHTPFILFTGRGSEEVASDAFSMGATDYLQKSGQRSKFELLANRIQQYVEKDKLLTERSRILQENNRLLERVSDAFMSFNESFEFLHLNERGVSLFNEIVEEEVSYDMLLGKCLWDVLPNSAVETVKEEYTEVIQGNSEEEFERYYEDMGLWLETRVFPSRDGFSVFIRDVTEQKLEQQRQNEESEMLFELYGIASDASLSAEERLSKAVRLGREFFGVSFGFVTKIQDNKQEIVLSENKVQNPKLAVGAVCPIDETYCQNVLDKQEGMAVTSAASSDEVETVAYERFELDSYISQKVYVEDEVYGTLCFADFSTQEEAFSDTEVAVAELLSGWVGFEIERELHREKLERQNERLDAFAGIVSHDLRNPLNVAEGYLKLACEEQDLSKLHKVEDAHSRMKTMISELLEFARSAQELPQSDLEQIKVSKLAQDAWKNISSDESELLVNTELVVTADVQKLLNVLENLFRNAVEHNSTPVTITVGDLTETDGFYIEDTGTGINSTEDLFSYNSSESTNLGLLIADEIVSAHNWKLHHIENTTSGARFEIHI